MSEIEHAVENLDGDGDLGNLSRAGGRRSTDGAAWARRLHRNLLAEEREGWNAADPRRQPRHP